MRHALGLHRSEAAAPWRVWSYGIRGYGATRVMRNALGLCSRVTPQRSCGIIRSEAAAKLRHEACSRVTPQRRCGVRHAPGLCSRVTPQRSCGALAHTGRDDRHAPGSCSRVMLQGYIRQACSWRILGGVRQERAWRCAPRARLGAYRSRCSKGAPSGRGGGLDSPGDRGKGMREGVSEGVRGGARGGVGGGSPPALSDGAKARAPPPPRAPRPPAGALVPPGHGPGTRALRVPEAQAL
jgi:hypothetical protein